MGDSRDVIFFNLYYFSEKADFSGINGGKDLKLASFAQLNHFLVSQVHNGQDKINV